MGEQAKRWYIPSWEQAPSPSSLLAPNQETRGDFIKVPSSRGTGSLSIPIASCRLSPLPPLAPSSPPISHPRVLQKASPFHTCFPSPGLAPAPPVGVHCPLTCSLAPQAYPQHAGSQGCPPLVPVFHVLKSSSKGGAHEGFPCGAPQGREGCKVQARVGPTGSGNVPVPMFLSPPAPEPSAMRPGS